MYIGLHVKYRYWCQILKQLGIFFPEFRLILQNPSVWRRIVPCGKTDE